MSARFFLRFVVLDGDRLGEGAELRESLLRASPEDDSPEAEVRKAQGAPEQGCEKNHQIATVRMN